MFERPSLLSGKQKHPGNNKVGQEARVYKGFQILLA
jgi:hypothetical protein